MKTFQSDGNALLKINNNQTLLKAEHDTKVISPAPEQSRTLQNTVSSTSVTTQG